MSQPTQYKPRRVSGWLPPVIIAALFILVVGSRGTFTGLPSPELDVSHREPLDVRFVDREARPRRLSEFKGRLVLVNVWATWCPPCRDEIPALEQLRLRIPDPWLAVLPISVDPGGVDVAARFLARESVAGLEPYAGEEDHVLHALKVDALPTTILVDERGVELGRMVGPADWGGDRGEALIARARSAQGRRTARK